MKIYVDDKYRCHTTNPDGTFREVEDPFFDNKCKTIIEGYCYDDSKGYVQIYPWKDYDELHAAQSEYESEKRIKALESESAALKEENDALKSENTMLTAQVSALSDQMDFYEECVVEMAGVVYA